VVVDVGSFLGVGGKYVAVPPTDIKTDNNRLTLDRTKEQLQADGGIPARESGHWRREFDLTRYWRTPRSITKPT